MKKLIYLEDAISEIARWIGYLDKDMISRIQIGLERLPAAQPERQVGAWIEYIPEHGKCPFCGNQVDLLNGKANNFCGECGSDMRGEQE